MNRPIVKIRVLKSKAALRAMVDSWIARGIAESMQGVTFRATLNQDGGADIVSGQDWPAYWLPRGTFSVFVSRAAALAQAKQLARYKATPRRHRK